MKGDFYTKKKEEEEIKVECIRYLMPKMSFKTNLRSAIK